VAAEGREIFWAFLKGEGCLVEGPDTAAMGGWDGRDPISMEGRKVWGRDYRRGREWNWVKGVTYMETRPRVMGSDVYGKGRANGV
jgi:hypothetical protein